MRLACACSIATAKGSNRPTVVVHYSIAEWPYSMNCARGVKNIEFLNDPMAGEVRIGSIAPLATSFVSAVIDRLSRRYPRVAFHLVTAQPSTLQRELSERGIDLFIARSPMADERLGFEFIFED